MTSRPASKPILDPPRWFWRLVDAAAGDPARLRADLLALDRETLALFYGYVRDLATRLMYGPHLARLPEGTLDDTAFEAGAWVVFQGRDVYRFVAADPDAMPRKARTGTCDERDLLGVAAEVHAELFGDEMPTDVEIEWRADGSAEPQ